jgi:hypothetical protein
MEDRFAADIVDFEQTHQIWSFLRQKYESIGQSTYLAAIRQEQLLRQGDTTVEDFFDQLSVVWRQLDTLGPQLSPATCQSCRDQTAALELHRTYDFLTQLRDEVEPLRAQLLARRPYVSLMDALAEVRNEEVRLRDAGLLQSTTVLAARSSAGRSSSTRPAAPVPLAPPPVVPPAAPVPLAPPPVVPPAAHGESGSLHCDHYGRDGHVEAFCYRKKKAQKSQAHCSSKVLMVLVLEDLRGVLLVQRHKRFSCCFVALRPLRRQELLVLWLSPLHLQVLLLLLSIPLWDHLSLFLQVLILDILILTLLFI